MASCYLNASTQLFVVAFRWDGKRFTKSFSSKEEAERFKADIEGDLQAAKRFNTEPAYLAQAKPRTERKGISNPTLPEFWEAFKDDAEADHGTQTVRSYESAYLSLKEHVSVKHLVDLQAKHFQGWKKKLQEEGYALPTINSYLRRAKVMLNFAVEGKMVAENPARTVKFLREDRYDPKPYLKKPEIDNVLQAALVHCRDPKVEEEIVEDFEEDPEPDSEAIAVSMPTGKPDIYWVFLLGIYAGLRLNEILNARWEWINQPRALDAGGSITVQSGYQFRVKARQARTIPLHARLRPFLYFKDEFGPTGYIVKPHITEWKPTGLRWDCRKQFDSVLKKAGLQTVNRYGHEQPVNRHTLRHTFCSMLAQNGYSAFEIMKLAGHSDIKVSESYMHLAPHEKGIDW